MTEQVGTSERTRARVVGGWSPLGNLWMFFVLAWIPKLHSVKKKAARKAYGLDGFG